MKFGHSPKKSLEGFRQQWPCQMLNEIKSHLGCCVELRLENKLKHSGRLAVFLMRGQVAWFGRGKGRWEEGDWAQRFWGQVDWVWWWISMAVAGHSVSVVAGWAWCLLLMQIQMSRNHLYMILWYVGDGLEALWSILESPVLWRKRKPWQ